MWDEKKLFDYLKDSYYTDLVMARNPMSRWDCYSPSTKHRIELKCRRSHYDTLLLEKNKYDAMVVECLKHNDIPMYINSTPKGIYAFDLMQIDPVWEVKRLRVTTDFSDQNWIYKKVMFLDINNSIWK